jgi:hypothetical protein
VKYSEYLYIAYHLLTAGCGAGAHNMITWSKGQYLLKVMPEWGH